MADQTLLIVSAVRNESRHIESVARAMAAQTRPPDTWIVVDDGSTDGTQQLLARVADEIPFMRMIAAPQRPLPSGADRLLHAAEARAFNYGLQFGPEFTHVGKLDGDVELRPDYYERLLAEFGRSANLGIAGGVLTEWSAGAWKLRGASHLGHVRGALKLYSKECFAAVGGVREMLGWDGVDDVLARMHGFESRSFPEIVARHHRVAGSADGMLRGQHRLGRCMYVEGYPPVWIAARAVKAAALPPYGLSGAAFAVGYAGAAMRRIPRFDEDGYREHLRRELRARAARKLNPFAPA